RVPSTLITSVPSTAPNVSYVGPGPNATYGTRTNAPSRANVSTRTPLANMVQPRLLNRGRPPRREAVSLDSRSRTVSVDCAVVSPAGTASSGKPRPRQAYGPRPAAGPRASVTRCRSVLPLSPRPRTVVYMTNPPFGFGFPDPDKRPG